MVDYHPSYRLFLSYYCKVLQISLSNSLQEITLVLDLVSQIRDAVLMNVYLDLGNPGGSGFWDGGYMNKGMEWEDQFTSNLGTKWTDPVTARRVPSK